MKTYTSKELRVMADKFEKDGDEALASLLVALSITRLIEEDSYITVATDTLLSEVVRVMHKISDSFKKTSEYLGTDNVLR